MGVRNKLIGAITNFVPKILFTFLFLFFIGSDYGDEFSGSIWLSMPFDWHPSWVLIVITIGLFFYFIKQFRFDRVYFLFGLLFVLGFVSSLLDFHFDLRQWVIDIKFFVITLSVYSVFKGLFTKHTEILSPLVLVIIGLSVLRFSVDFVLLLMNSGVEFIPGVTRVSLDSTKTLIVLLVGLLIILTPRLKFYPVTLAVGVLLTSLAFSYGSRMIYFDLAILGFTLFILLNRTRLLRSISTLLVITFISFYALFLFNEKNAEISFSRAENITVGRPVETFSVPTEYNVISRIDPIRYAQFQNIFLENLTVKRILIGRGIGGFYTDDYVEFPRNIGSTFTEQEFATGRFYRTHNFLSHFCMKYGVIGVSIIVYIWL